MKTPRLLGLLVLTLSFTVSGQDDLAKQVTDLMKHAETSFQAVKGKERVSKPNDSYMRFDSKIKFIGAADQEIVEDKLEKTVKFVAYFTGSKVEARRLFDSLVTSIKTALGPKFDSEVIYDDPEDEHDYDKDAIFTRKAPWRVVLKVVYEEALSIWDPVKSYVHVEVPSVAK